MTKMNSKGCIYLAFLTFIPEFPALIPIRWYNVLFHYFLLANNN